MSDRDNSVTHLTDADAAKIADAVAKKMAEDHVCKFSPGERHVMHLLSEKLDDNSIQALGVLGSWCYRTGITVGNLVGKAVMIGLFVAFLAGVVAVGWLINRGFIKP